MNLSPCPFCGNAQTNILSVEQTGGNTKYVQCQKCGARGPWFNYKDTPEEKWNTRQVTFPLPDQRDERHDFLEKTPTKNLFNILEDLMTNDAAMSFSFFLVSAHPFFRQTKPPELFDLITAELHRRRPAAQPETADK